MAPIAAASGRGGVVMLIAGVVGGLLPDADHPGSAIGRWIPWPSVRQGPYHVGRRRPGGVIWHRGELHSAGAAVIAGGIAATVTASFRHSLPPGSIALSAIGIVIGYLSHLAADMLSPSPQMLLWPLSHERWRPEWLPGARMDSAVGRVLEGVVSAFSVSLLLGIAGRWTLSFYR